MIVDEGDVINEEEEKYGSGLDSQTYLSLSISFTSNMTKVFPTLVGKTPDDLDRMLHEEVKKMSIGKFNNELEPLVTIWTKILKLLHENSI